MSTVKSAKLPLTRKPQDGEISKSPPPHMVIPALIRQLSS